MIGSGVTSETIRLKAVRDLTEQDMEDIRVALLEMPDRLNRPWGTKAPLIAALRQELVQIRAEAPTLEDYAECAVYFATYKTKAWFVMWADEMGAGCSVSIPETGNRGHVRANNG